MPSKDEATHDSWYPVIYRINPRDGERQLNLSDKTRYWIWRLPLALGFRYLCFVVMVGMAVWNEARPAPHLPDRVLDLIPYQEAIADKNYIIWVWAALPITAIFAFRLPARAFRFFITGGILSLIRGLCILTTGLGPVRGDDYNVGLSAADRWSGILAIADPFQALGTDAAFVYLTKDLFFSGHVATTFLLLLYVWPDKKLRYPMLIAHIVVTASVFAAHIHYTIDVIGAYAITLALFTIREGRVQDRVAS